MYCVLYTHNTFITYRAAAAVSQGQFICVVLLWNEGH